jgi:aspartate racemase
VPAALTLGVLGGMGPAATLDFLAKLQDFTPAKRDADHIRVLADINPHVPDLATPGSNPGPVLAEMAGALAGAGANVLAITCHTAHSHLSLIERASGLPVIDMISLAAAEADALEAHRVGVLGTRGALRVYREYLAAKAMGLVSLDAERQAALVEVINRIKAGDTGAKVRRELIGFAAELERLGAEVIILGCTEIPLALDDEDVDLPLIEPTELLAQRCVAVCLGLEPAPVLAD